MTRARASVVGLLVACALAGCVSAIPHATEDDATLARARYGAVAVADLEADRATYVRRCAGCHNLYEPSRQSPDAWPATVAEMGKRGGIPQGDLGRIERYLVTMSGRAKR